MLLLLALNVEGAKKKKKTQKKVVKKEVVATPIKMQPNTASTLMLCNTDYGMPTWYLNMVRGFKFSNDITPPANYRLVTINEMALNEYLKTIPFEKSDMKIKIPVYRNRTIDCIEFTIERVTTMDSVLQAKYPELMSFRIFEKENLLNAGRVDCDGKSTKVVLTYNSETYFVTPVVFNTKTYYACYSKNDPNFQKKPFESK